VSRPHVLLARQDSAGDVLLAGPAARAVAARARRVTFLCGPRGRAAAELLPGVDEVLCWQAPWIDAEPGPATRATMEELLDELARRRIDQAIVLTSFHQSPLPLALLLRMAGVRTIAGISADYPGSLLDVRHHVDERQHPHEVERALGLVATLGYELPRGDNGRLAIRPLPPRPGPPAPEPPYVVVHPGASVPARAWAPERGAALVRALARSGWRVAVTGSGAERGLTALVAGPSGPEVTDLGGRLSLAGLAQVLAGAEAVVVGNTGPAHLAAAVGSPVVSLFAPTVPAARWRPWGVPLVLLGRQDAPCAGSRARACPVPGHPCLNDVGVEEVLAALETVAVRTPEPRHEEAARR
jgi:ADP-heptose:LPS heptosyltransferase